MRVQRGPAFSLTLAYDGTAFGGWQSQPNQRTVQGELEQAFRIITHENVHCVASGRTDAGVHALGQVVSFVSETKLRLDLLQKGLNSQLPDDMHIFSIRREQNGFHAIRDAIRKRYRYVLQDGHTPDIFGLRYAWYSYHPLDEQAMHRAAQHLVGKHDFKSYQTTGSSRITTERTVYEVVVQRQPGERLSHIVIEVEADGFLYNMVRNIVGTLVEVGRGRADEEHTARVLLAKDRRRAGVTAPPQGLFLLSVGYDIAPLDENAEPEIAVADDVAIDSEEDEASKAFDPPA